MKASTTNKAEGKLRAVKGGTKEAVGATVKDRDMEVEGKSEKKARKVRSLVGRVERSLARLQSGHRARRTRTAAGVRFDSSQGLSEGHVLTTSQRAPKHRRRG
jgi:uncharacterized protein YjbJ (UPF0337 family)